MIMMGFKYDTICKDITYKHTHIFQGLYTNKRLHNKLHVFRLLQKIPQNKIIYTRMKIQLPKQYARNNQRLLVKSKINDIL